MEGSVIQSGPMALNLVQSPGCTQLEYLLEEKYAVSVSALLQRYFTCKLPCCLCHHHHHHQYGLLRLDSEFLYCVCVVSLNLLECSS